jgi:hypothetical protein
MLIAGLAGLRHHILSRPFSGILRARGSQGLAQAHAGSAAVGPVVYEGDPGRFQPRPNVAQRAPLRGAHAALELGERAPPDICQDRDLALGQTQQLTCGAYLPGGDWL